MNTEDQNNTGQEKSPGESNKKEGREPGKRKPRRGGRRKPKASGEGTAEKKEPGGRAKREPRKKEPKTGGRTEKSSRKGSGKSRGNSSGRSGGKPRTQPGGRTYKRGPKKLLSIITVTYNCEKAIVPTIKSVMDNKPAGVEYLIVDGGSTDRTLDAIMPWHDKIDRIISEPDGGIYDAMNKGLDAADGTYVLFINAGDRIHNKEVLPLILAAIQKERADVFYGETMLIDRDGNEIGLRSEKSSRRLPESLDWKKLKYGMVVSHQSFIVRWTTAPKYDLDFTSSSDIDWVIRCLKESKKTVNLHTVISDYQVGGYSKRTHKRSLWERYRILQKHYGVVPNFFYHIMIMFRAIWFTILGKPLN